ncbi:N-acyl-aromatic-L-amino acid amidohydrolase (carboxylate-forming) B-like [Boleophthalmus pectinirostris]|uniref:N-acyl-aromatic-L-amino acid amidohydrolase (carboxylate-forming) B-like n=1 Tax=Boleophthalmus pectinirostris TaxID=150288 RepID=UPI002430654F|nr:N-acyl-aromatic-L-amino acid amidohydrolase (carboxylate-forming) B-like [Boleophthalmus pectinirostris]
MDKQECVCLPKLSRVAVCGGTHGNELSGVYLVKELMKRRPQEDDEDRNQPILVLSNPRATQKCLRYIEVDLNRCFSHDALNSPLSDSTPYEVIRAHELNTQLGPKGSPDSVDLVCDLHNTTANMGLCLISFSDSDWISMHIFKHLQQCIPDIPMRYIHFDLPSDESYSLDSVGKHGFAIEIGPQPHGVVRSNVYTTMKDAVEHMLDWVRLFNSGTVFEGGPVDVFTLVKHIDYPRDCNTHDVIAAIHPQLQDKDFCLLNPGDPVFQTFSGETTTYNGSESLYPFFINECAYYEKGIAFSLSRKRCVKVPTVWMHQDQSNKL